MSLIDSILSIFVDTTSKREMSQDFHQNLTDHYQKEYKNNVIDEIWVAAAYKDIENTIESYKYRSHRESLNILIQICMPLLLRLLEQIGHKNVVIVPVPMHWSRYLIRGFDHMQLFSDTLAQSGNIPSISLLDAKFSRRQSQLSKQARVKNREHAYTLKKGVKIPKTVILIDDVISTGSTALACAKILKKAGVERIYGLFLASNQN